MMTTPVIIQARRLCSLLIVCIVPFAVLACSSSPEDSILEKRLSATIDLGWGWVKAENVVLNDSHQTGEGVIGSFTYDLVIQKDAHLLPQTAVDTFRKFIPQCNSVPIQKGKRCVIEETLLFVESSSYGWVPEVVTRLRPELLGPISAWEHENAAD